jgi:hypothetical protein
MEGAPPGANQIDLFMHFLGASRDGLVARRVDLDTISSSVSHMYYTHFNLLMLNGHGHVYSSSSKPATNMEVIFYEIREIKNILDTTNYKENVKYVRV